MDVRLATENVLAEFLREIKYIANVQEKQAEAERIRREALSRRHRRPRHHDAGEAIVDDDDDEDDEEEGGESDEDDETETEQGHGHHGPGGGREQEEEHDWEGEGSGAWVPGQGVFVDHAAIMDIIIQHLSYPGECFLLVCVVFVDKLMADELVQSTAMEWILTFLEFAETTVVAFTPRIVPAILPNLASQQ